MANGHYTADSAKLPDLLSLSEAKRVTRAGCPRVMSTAWGSTPSTRTPRTALTSIVRG